MKRTWLFRVYIELSYTAQLYGDYSKPLRGSLLNIQHSGQQEFFLAAADDYRCDNDILGGIQVKMLMRKRLKQPNKLRICMNLPSILCHIL